jgi:hypothetical protein
VCDVPMVGAMSPSRGAAAATKLTRRLLLPTAESPMSRILKEHSWPPPLPAPGEPIIFLTYLGFRIALGGRRGPAGSTRQTGEVCCVVGFGPGGPATYESCRRGRG